MPYNKGDFTQQGINGDVSALVRLNEKRVMKVVLSSDDESDNCDISGSVIDELNDKTYTIGTGVSGNIEITENGENINVAPYATATVNVAGGGADVRKCAVTVNNTSANTGQATVLSFDENGCLSVSEKLIPSNGSATLNYLVMYDTLLNSFVPANFPSPSFWDSFGNVDFDGDPPAFTNLVNATVNETMQPLVTDPTTDASFTVRVGFASIS